MTEIKDLTISKYTEKSIVVRGNIEKYKKDLQNLGGKYNYRLRDSNSEEGYSPGYIFWKGKQKDILKFVKKGKVENTCSYTSTPPTNENTFREEIKDINDKLNKVLRNQKKIFSLIKSLEKIFTDGDGDGDGDSSSGGSSSGGSCVSEDNPPKMKRLLR